MNRSDNIEITLIGLATALAVPATFLLPSKMAMGEIALAASALLLAQGLARDLWLKYGRKNITAASCTISNSSAESGDRQPATCMCMESSLGVIGITAGALALLSGSSHSVEIPVYFWPALVLSVGLIGFAIKSLVIDWKARRIRRESNHSAVRFGK